MRKVTTIFINSNTSNPIAVECVIRGQKENGSWYWEIEEIKSIELIIGDKEGVDITKQILPTARALALIYSQVADQEDQIIDELTHNKTAA